MYLIIKNILNKVYIHPLFIVSLFIFVLLGRFRFLSYFMLLILIHELGHITVSLIFKWKIDRIIILPFGGLTKYNVNINTPLIQEFLVSISGIIFQLIFYILIVKCVNYNYFSLINWFIIAFNLVPIYPLDGSKILNVLFNIITNYKNSILLTVIVSYVFIIGLTVYFFYMNKMIVIIVLFLLLEVNKLYKNRDFLFNRFILERYIENYGFKKEKIINNICKMKKDYRHIFYINGKYSTEKNYLDGLYNMII